MRRPFLVGEHVYLRGLEKKDLNERYFQWLNDQETTRFMYHGTFPNTKQAMRNFFKRATCNKNDVVFAIVLKEEDRHIGNVGIHNIDWINRFGAIGILIGEKNCRGKGFGQEALELVVNYGFNKLNLNKINISFHAGHKAAIRCYSRVGFKKEGIAREEFFRDGVYHDRVLMGITRGDYEKIRVKAKRKA